PAHDLAADHPVERAAVAQLVGALGHHACPVHVLGREPALPALLELLADPILEILDRVTADAELDEMKGHGGYCRTKCDEIIPRGAGVATRAGELILRRGARLLRGGGGRGRRPRGCGAGRRTRRRPRLRRPAWRRRRRGLGRAGCVLGLPLRRRWFRGHDIDRRGRLFRRGGEGVLGLWPPPWGGGGGGGRPPPPAPRPAGRGGKAGCELRP